MANAKAKATKRSAAAALPQGGTLPQAGDIPEGFQQIGGGYAPTWDPKKGDSIQGPTTGDVKVVEMTIGRKKQERRCVEITDVTSGERVTVWESAVLGQLFDQLADAGQGTEVYIRFDGTGKAKKAGQNPPKLYTAAIAA